MNRMLDQVIRFTLTGSLAMLAAAAVAEEEKPDSYIKLDETVISGNQELPKVLYIVPWQDPDGMPNINLNPDFTEAQVFRRLYPPAYKRELNYYELLEASEKE